jgi:subtilase family serine protease
MLRLVRNRSFFVAASLIAAWAATASAQSPDRITRPVDEGQVVTLEGNVHPLARAEFDEGALAADAVLARMVLELEPSAAQQAELDALVEAQHDPHSPLYQQWLTPAEYGARFGAGARDVARICDWLRSHGFAIDEVAASRRQIQFSGTAEQVAEAFHTEIHRYSVDGVEHLANAQDPQIPAAFAGVVGGVVSLHDFRRKSEISAKRPIGSAAVNAGTAARSQHGARTEYSDGTTHYLFPADWATIYDLSSLYSAGKNGTGSSIAIVGRSNINASDVASFRSASGLPANQPSVILVSTNPGLVSGDQDESTLDVEWSGAVAPGAAVKFVVGASTSTTDGVDLSAQYIVNHATAQVVSTSYGSCEQDMGAAELAFYNGLWQQAASEGISAFVSSGDSGAAGCDGGSSSKGTVAGVNGLCSSPYSTCVGGTEFNEGANASRYWSASDGANYESALGYIPEEVWNESASNGGSGLWASTGGVSTTYAQPSWQKGIAGTSASNGMRAVPDVAMSASSHDGYVIVEDGSYWIIGGTSAASPSFAGVMALVVQGQGGKGQGNANPGLYALLGAAKNPFHATPSGNNTVPGVTGFTASGAAYNLATGLGSVDGALLVSGWGTASTPVAGANFALTQSATSGSLLAGKSTTFTVGVTESGSAKNAVALTVKAASGVTATVSPASIVPGTTAAITLTVASTAMAGAQSVVVTGSNSSGTQTATYALTVTQAPTLTLTANSSSASVVRGAKQTVSLTAATGGSFSGSISWTVSGLPSGVTATWSANPLATSASVSSNAETLTLTAASAATLGSAQITVTAAGDGLTASSKVTVQVTPAAGITLAASPGSVPVQSLATAMVTVTATPVGGLAIAGKSGIRTLAQRNEPVADLASTVATASDAPSISIVSGLPAGFTATWSAASFTPAGAVTWTLKLTGSSKAAAGASTLNLLAQVASAAGGASYSAAAALPITVTRTPPTLAVTAASSALSVAPKGSVSDVVTLAGNGTHCGAASLSITGLPAGVTASWSSSAAAMSGATGTSKLTLTAASTAKARTAVLTVTARGDGITATKQVRLTVQ